MATKKEILAQQVARAVGAGKSVALDTVDFNDPNRPKTCLDAESSARWNQERSSKIRLLEVRGELPEEVTCRQTQISFKSAVGTVPKTGNFACSACGTVQPIVTSIEATKKTAPASVYAVQGFSERLEATGNPYGGRFFLPVTESDSLVLLCYLYLSARFYYNFSTRKYNT